MQPNGTSKEKVYEFPPFENEEVYFCRVVQVIYLGLQPGGEWQGTKKPDVEQVMVTFEFGEVRTSEDKPAWLSAFFNLPKRWEDSGAFQSMHIKSSLYKFLSIVYPDGLYPSKNDNYVGFAHSFKWEGVLGKPVQVGVKVVSGDNGTRAYLNMDTLGRVPSKFISSVAELENTPVVVVDIDSITPEEWSVMLPWVRNKILGSLSEEISLKARELNTALLDKDKKETNNKPKAKTNKVNNDNLNTPFDDDIPF